MICWTNKRNKMNNQTIINIMKSRINNSQSRDLIRTATIFNRIPYSEFLELYERAKREVQNERVKFRQKKESKFGRRISFRVSPELLERFQNWVNRDPTIKKKNVSYNYRNLFEIGLDYSLENLEVRNGKEV